ncbi:hypothetical protein DFH28DRAFT_882310 [Melampsora americana]|nr:hypothetical protein DFH28DRAFT_882310 [Melampsora americana]
MDLILNDGLIQLDNTLLSTAFQIAFNLSILPQSITLIIQNLNQSIQSKIKSTFDLNSLAKQSNLKDQLSTSTFVYKSRSRTEPTSSNHSQWTNVLWSRLDSLIDDLSSSCIKVYTLEKVLEWKKTSIPQKSFLDEVIEKSTELDSTSLRTIFWTTLSVTLENECREISRGSNFINQTLTSSYPRLLRLFHDFFSRISLHTHTNYNQTIQSPETILTLRAIAPFESVYLERSKNRIIEGLNTFKIEKLNPILINELDAARFDPLLIKSVAKNIKEILNDYLSQISDRIDREQQSNSVLGFNLFNGSQFSNIETCNLISNLMDSLNNLIIEYSTTNPEISDSLSSIVNQSKAIQTKILNPIINSIKREYSLLIGKMHLSNHNQSKPSNTYTKELIQRINIIKTEILHQIQTDQVIHQTINYLIDCFLFHLSLKSELNERCKLNLTSEISEIEFNLTQLIEEDEMKFDRDLGELSYKLKKLRDFKQIIFNSNLIELEKEIQNKTKDEVEVEEKGEKEKEVEFKRMIVVSHLLSRNEIQIHKILGWSEIEYWKWLEKHFDSILDWNLLVKKVLGEKVFNQSLVDERIQNQKLEENEELGLVRKILEC